MTDQPRLSRAAVFWVIVASLACVLFVAARILYTGNTRFVWLVVPNLVLAWVPLVLALLLVRLPPGRWLRAVLGPALGILWLLFYPNSLYIVTDIPHAFWSDGLLRWYDLVLVLTYALTGLYLGFLSLYLLQEVVAARWGASLGWSFALAVLGLASVGVYLGRFVRWNSWYVFTRPLTLGRSALDVLRHPLAYRSPLALILAFAVFFGVAYLAWFSTASLRSVPARSGR